ncbi:MAG: FAD-binding oxidoreductase [Proteobacteria bacterium]|nr:FAD-binding oxidoreductase [Pseudomonadota bacterium]
MEYIEKLKKALSSEKISIDDDILKTYSEDLSFADPCTPDCVVYPETVEEIRDVVEIARGNLIPVVPVSSGAPRFRGDTVPGMGGIMVDLGRMKQIVRIDRTDKVVMVQPGVVFSQLRDAVEKEGMKIMTPLCPRDTKSVLTSALEREPHIIPKYHLDHSEPMLCSELVLGTGDIYRTGDAAGPGTIEEQWEVGRKQKNPMSFWTDEFRYFQASQGNFGILSWTVLRCEVLPTIEKPYLAWSEKIEDILELGHQLVRRRLGDEIFILDRHAFAQLVGKDEAEIRSLRERLPSWILFYNLAGYEFCPEERIAYQEKDVKKTAQKMGIHSDQSILEISARRVLKTANGTCEEPWRLKANGGCQEIPFIASYHDISKLISIMHSACIEFDFPLKDLGVYIQPVCQGHGHHCEFSLMYDPGRIRQADKVKALYMEASSRLMNKGAFFSRPYDLLAHSVLNRDGASLEALKKIKPIYDPDGIMNPGKLCF